jgi:hypothetical protein
MKDHSLIPVAPGRHRQYVLFDTTNQPDAELELRLPQGAVVKGQVTDESGRPVPSAYLHRPASGTALTLNGWDELCQADGSFAYGGLPARSATHSLEVVAPGYRSQTLTIQVMTSDEVIWKAKSGLKVIRSRKDTSNSVLATRISIHRLLATIRAGSCSTACPLASTNWSFVTPVANGCTLRA